jgi:hypothetical protein
MEEEADAKGMEFAKEPYKVSEGPTKSVDRPSCHQIELASRGGLEHGIELGAFLASLGAADGVIHEFGYNFPA